MIPEVTAKTNSEGLFLQTDDVRIFLSREEIPTALEVFRFIEAAKLPKFEIEDVREFLETVDNFMKARKWSSL